eukprot:3675935-Ditylum_brightwellii.AAC.1
MMKHFQLQGLANYPLSMVIYVSFLVPNLEIGKSNKVELEIKKLKEEIKSLASEVKATKGQASVTVTEADKALLQKGKHKN